MTTSHSLRTRGWPVVLTADRCLTADHRLLFDGMLAASQTTITPGFLMDLLLQPRPVGPGCPAPTAPLGLRRIEAALLRDGYTRDEVVVTASHGLAQAIGPETRVIGISTGEPLGRGMNSGTMTAVAGGRIWPAALFQQLAHIIRGLRQRVPEARLVVGGPGAWQLADDESARAELGIDHVITGHAEGDIAAILRQLMAGSSLPAVIPAKPPLAADIPALRGPATFGAVELSRGCGLRCDFCTMAGAPMRHLSPAQIAVDVHTNRAAGLRHVALLSEDAFRYGADGLRVVPAQLLGLLEELRRLPGLGLMQIDHANIATAARWSDAELISLRRLLAGDDTTPVWVNCGVESSDGNLLVANGGMAKLGGCPPESWAGFCAEQLKRLCRAGFTPFASLVMGLPGETPDHVTADRRWIASLAGEPLAIFPMTLAPLAAPWMPPALRRDHWELMRSAYALNFRIIPRLYAAQCRSAGVPFARRALVQMLGQGQIMQWSALFSWRRWWAGS